MIFREILIDDNSMFNNIEYICSDYIFSYLYMYGDLYKLRIYHDDRCVIIRSDYLETSFYMPIGDIEYGIRLVLEYCRRNSIDPVLAKIPNSYVDTFKALRFSVKEDRNSFDYIYRNSELLEYKGKDFRKQRNNMSSYLKTYSPMYSDDISNHVEDLKVFTQKYHDRNDIINPTFRIIESLNEFNCRGGIVWNKGIIQGFCIYEKINDDMVLSHVELTDNTHRGIHAYMINEMSKRIDVEYINKEDDVGLPGLRTFKESYSPYHMLKKYTASYQKRD